MADDVLQITQNDHYHGNVSGHYPVFMKLRIDFTKIKVTERKKIRSNARVNWQKVDKHQYQSRI